MTDFKDDQNSDEIDAGAKSGSLDRREFGKLLAAGVGAAALGMTGCTTAAPRSISSCYLGGDYLTNVDVIVIGAGLSGLIAARRVQQEAKSVIVLEANSYIGGRMYLSPDSTKDGYSVDMGGQWVGETQFDMQRLVDELRDAEVKRAPGSEKLEHFANYEAGRSIEQWYDPDLREGFNGNLACLLEGRCSEGSQPEVKFKPENCPPPGIPDIPDCKGKSEERTVMGMVWKALIRISDLVPADKPWDPLDPAIRQLDEWTFEEWLDSELGKKEYGNFSPSAKKYAKELCAMQARTGGSGGFEPGKVSMLHMAWTQKVGRQSHMPEVWLLRGGAGQIPALLAKQIREESLFFGEFAIRTNEAVTKVEHRSPGFFVYTECLQGGADIACSKPEYSGKVYVYACEAVIVAIPPTMRARIAFPFPENSPQYQRFIEKSKMGSMSKMHLVYPTAFWRNECLSGSVAGNLETCEFIVDCSNPEGVPGVLTTFIAGDRNAKITTKGITKENDPAAEKLFLEDVCQYFGGEPGIDESKRSEICKKFHDPHKFYFRNWNVQPWACGAFTSYMPPYGWTESGLGWREPIEFFEPSGRICWAGTETSDRWPGYFDGAIRAGLRAAGQALGLKPGEWGIYDPAEKREGWAKGKTFMECEPHG